MNFVIDKAILKIYFYFSSTNRLVFSLPSRNILSRLDRVSRENILFYSSLAEFPTLHTSMHRVKFFFNTAWVTTTCLICVDCHKSKIVKTIIMFFLRGQNKKEIRN